MNGLSRAIILFWLAIHRGLSEIAVSQRASFHGRVGCVLLADAVYGFFYFFIFYGYFRVIGPQLLPNITTAAGGVPIRVAGKVVGAVGVSGTPSSAGGGEGDAKCASSGIEKVIKE